MSVELGSAHGKIVIDSSGVTTGIATALSGLQRLETQVTAIGRNLSRVGDQLTQSLTLPILAVGVSSGKMSMDFESSMQKIAGLVGVSQEQVKAWSDDLLKMGPALGRTPKELADALYQITSSGVPASDALDVLDKSARAASAGLGETQVVADAVTSVMNAYKTSNMTAATAVDVLTAAVREGKGEASAIAPVLGNVIPIAAQLGVSFDQVAASIASMTLVGFDAATASTNLSGIMSALLKPSKQASDELARFGLSGDQLREMLSKPTGLLDVLNLLSATVGQDDEALAKIFPNIRGLRGMFSLLGENATQVNGIFERTKGSAGDMGEAFDIASHTMKFKFDSAISSGQSSLIKFGNAVLPIVTTVLQELAATLGRVADWFGKLPASTQETIIKVLALTAALGPLLSIGGRLLTTLGSLLSVFTTMSKVILESAINFGKLVTTGKEVVQYLVEAGVSAGSLAVAFAAVAAVLVIVVKLFDAASRAAHATNEELIAMANSDTGNAIEDQFNRAGAAIELMANGSGRLRDVFIAHQAEMRKQLDAGQITLEEYNAEIERSAKVAGVWRTGVTGMAGNVDVIDKAVVILTKDQLKQAGATDEVTIASRIATAALSVLTSGVDGVKKATDDATQKALEFAAAQEAQAADVEAGTAMLDNLRSLIDGEVGPAYEDFIGKNEDLIAKQQELRTELEKLQAGHGKMVTVQKKGALTAAELAQAQLQLADAQAKLASETNPLKQANLAVKIEDLTGKIQGADSATTTWVDNSKRIGEIEGKLGELDTALKENADAYDERLKRILFDMAAEQLAMDGMTTAEAGALNALALKFGLIDQATADMTTDVLNATAQLAQDKNVENFVNNLTTDFDRAKTRAAGVPADLVAVGEAYNQMAQDASTHGGAVVTATATMADQIGDPISRAQESFGKLATGVTTTAGTVKTQTGAMQTATATALSGMDSTIKQYGPGIGTPLLSGVQTMSSGVIDVLNGILEKVAEVISSFLGIKVPNIQLPGGSGTGGGGSGGGPSPTPAPSPSPSPEPTCFTGDTLVTLADGSQCPIDQLRHGDHVLTFDPITAEFSAGVVTETLVHYADGYTTLRTASGLTLHVTGEHPIYAPRRRADVPTIHGDFVRVRDLQIGDALTTPDHDEVLTAIEEVAAPTVSQTARESRVYNLNVEPHHTYLANGVIVHNIKLGAGGAFAAGQQIIINENPMTRPEVLVPSRPGYVLTRQDAQAALRGAAGGGAGGIYVTIPVTQVGDAVDAELLARRVVAIIQDRRRG